eukprot:9188462-Ditylum_brightwellii.AAC.1
MIWPYTLKAAEDRHNKYTVDNEGVSSEEKFVDIKIIQDLKEEHTLGCPVHVLDHRIQDSSGVMPKWEPRARLGINIGRSSSHASNAHLIMNPRTGH